MSFNKYSKVSIRMGLSIRPLATSNKSQLIRRPNRCRLSSSLPNEYGNPNEVSIPVPWGKIAAKRWGNEQGKPILAVHGYLDNAASMDGLIPLLPLSEYDVVAIDLPGHGFSSHYAPGMTYRLSDALVALRRVQIHFGWEKSNIIAHSMGAAIASWFAATFPEHVDRLAMIDLINVGPTPLQKQVRTTRKSLEKNIELNDKLTNTSDPPSYTFLDACGRAFLANQFLLHQFTEQQISNAIQQYVCIHMNIYIYIYMGWSKISGSLCVSRFLNV